MPSSARSARTRGSAVRLLAFRSASRAEDAALLALADLAAAVPGWDRCRVVGGHMVAIHVLLAERHGSMAPTCSVRTSGSGCSSRRWCPAHRSRIPSRTCDVRAGATSQVRDSLPGMRTWSGT